MKGILMNKGSNSKQLGREIARLMGIAKKVKEQEQAKSQPKTKEIPESAWRTAAVEAIEERDKLIGRLQEVRRQKLANFSLSDIEKELQRRLTNGG